MRRLIPLLGLLTITSVAVVQPARAEVPKPAPSADTSTPTTNAVPDVYALSGQFDRIVLLRFKSQTDLLDGLERMVKEQKIRNGVILAALGSVRSWHYHTISKPGSPTQDVYVKNPEVPADILSMNGLVIDGRVHAHFTMADLDKAFGGHLVSGTTVHTFAVVTIGVFKDGIDLNRIDDRTYR